MPPSKFNRTLLFGLVGVGVVACLGLGVALLAGSSVILNRQTSTT